jgi:hypothetical protein
LFAAAARESLGSRTNFGAASTWEGDMKSIALGIALSFAAAAAAPVMAGPLNLPAVLAAPPAVELVQYLPKSGFHNPMANGAPVDWCATYANNCGAGGATLFCQQHGFSAAVNWQTFMPGQTYVLGSNQFCNGNFCTGFSFVRCGGVATGAATPSVTVTVTPGTTLTPGTTPPAGGAFPPGSGFQNPIANGAAVDWCSTYAKNCGAGGAGLFCQQHGFAHAISWKTFHPGQTYVLGSNQFCNGNFCIGFSFVQCG